MASAPAAQGGESKKAALLACAKTGSMGLEGGRERGEQEGRRKERKRESRKEQTGCKEGRKRKRQRKKRKESGAQVCAHPGNPRRASRSQTA